MTNNYPKHLKAILSSEQVAREKRFAVFADHLNLTPAAAPHDKKKKIQQSCHDHARYFKTADGQQLLLFDAPYSPDYPVPPHIATEWIDAACCPYKSNCGTYPRLSCLRTNDKWQEPLVDLQILALIAENIIYEEGE
jgi:hypothetical protein